VTAAVELAGGRVLLERDVGITVRDGVRLSCDVYRPNREGRFPALLEHIPYRKDDFRHARDRAQGVYFAERGFVTTRLDVRGTGSSGGVAVDEYTVDEQEDAVEVVAWMADQPWCTGKVGSWGVSYGGFACIQLAARRPPALAAIAPVYATDDRYTDDMHFFGGALCALELAHYPIRMIAMNALPPLPRPDESDGELRERWLERIDATPPWIVRWVAEQHDSAYWRNGSLRPDYGRIQCAVFIVAGWRDGYRTAGLRMAAELEAPWQLLAGPWAHFPPDVGRPGPRYPFLRELVAFFEKHLGGAPAPERPRTVFFLNGFDSPARPPAAVSGTWLGSDTFPEPGGETVLRLHPGGRLASDEPSDAAEVACPFAPTVGVTNGNWCAPPPAHGLPADQRWDEVRSLTFTTEPLSEPLAVLGIPVARLRVLHPGPTALVSVRLADVAPDGQSQLVTRGVLNLAHRNGHTEPAPVAGPVDVEVELQATGWRFATGHRLRVAISGADWPTVWPLPSDESPVLAIGAGAPAEMRLPAPPPDAHPFEPQGEPDDLTGRVDEKTTGKPAGWRIVSDTFTGTSGIESWNAVTFALDGGSLTGRESARYEAALGEDDPLRADVQGEAAFELSRPGLEVEARARGVFGCTADEFEVELELQVDANGDMIHRREWHERVPRRLV